jgi:predicted transcriptional regulator
MGNPSDQILTSAYDALNMTPRSASDIWKIVGCWGRHTVKHALDDLHARGFAIREDRSHQGGRIVHFYRKLPDSPENGIDLSYPQAS